MYQVLENNFYDDKNLIQMRSQAKSGSIKIPEVHGVRKNFRSQPKARKTNIPYPNKEVWKGCM